MKPRFVSIIMIALLLILVNSTKGFGQIESTPGMEQEQAAINGTPPMEDIPEKGGGKFNNDLPENPSKGEEWLAYYTGDVFLKHLRQEDEYSEVINFLIEVGEEVAQFYITPEERTFFVTYENLNVLHGENPEFTKRFVQDLIDYGYLRDEFKKPGSLEYNVFSNFMKYTVPELNAMYGTPTGPNLDYKYSLWNIYIDDDNGLNSDLASKGIMRIKQNLSKNRLGPPAPDTSESAMVAGYTQEPVDNRIASIPRKKVYVEVKNGYKSDDSEHHRSQRIINEDVALAKTSKSPSRTSLSDQLLASIPESVRNRISDQGTAGEVQIAAKQKTEAVKQPTQEVAKAKPAKPKPEKPEVLVADSKSSATTAKDVATRSKEENLTFVSETSIAINRSLIFIRDQIAKISNFSEADPENLELLELAEKGDAIVSYGEKFSKRHSELMDQLNNNYQRLPSAGPKERGAILAENARINAELSQMSSSVSAFMDRSFNYLDSLGAKFKSLGEQSQKTSISANSLSQKVETIQGKMDTVEEKLNQQSTSKH